MSIEIDMIMSLFWPKDGGMSSNFPKPSSGGEEAMSDPLKRRTYCRVPKTQEDDKPLNKPKRLRKKKTMKKYHSPETVDESLSPVSGIKESSTEIEPEFELPTLDGPYFQSVEEGISWEDFSDPYASSLDDSTSEPTFEDNLIAENSLNGYQPYDEMDSVYLDHDYWSETKFYSKREEKKRVPLIICRLPPKPPKQKDESLAPTFNQILKTADGKKSLRGRYSYRCPQMSKTIGRPVRCVPNKLFYVIKPNLNDLSMENRGWNA